MKSIIQDTSPILTEMEKLEAKYKEWCDKLKDLNKDALEIKSSKEKSNLSEKIQTLLTENDNYLNICKQQLNVLNKTYFSLKTKQHNIDLVINKLNNSQKTIAQFDTFQGYLIKKHLKELIEFEAFIENTKMKKKKNSKYKTLKYFKLNISTVINTIKKEEQKSSLNIDKKVCNLDNNIGDMDDLVDITYSEFDGHIGKDEQLFCYCNYVVYGDMINCEYEECKRKWFHFNCVGIKVIPKEKWFCSQQCFNSYQAKKSVQNIDCKN